MHRQRSGRSGTVAPCTAAFVAVLAMLACTLPAALPLPARPGSTASPADTPVPTWTSWPAPTDTPIESPTPTPLSFAAMTLTQAPIANGTVTPTDTATPTGLPVADFNVVEQTGSKGIYLQITGPGLPDGYRLGPLARGAHALGPNGRFLVYVSNAGDVDVLRLGSSRFVQVANLRPRLISQQMRMEPIYDLSFAQAEYALYLIIREKRFAQYFQVLLPAQLVN